LTIPNSRFLTAKSSTWKKLVGVDSAKVSNDYYSNGQLKSVTREKTQQAHDSNKQLLAMQYDYYGSIASQTAS
jgi:hypothetical protein